MMPLKLSSLAALMALSLLLPGTACAQSADAVKLQSELMKSSSSPSFYTIVNQSLNTIKSADDVLWILDSVSTTTVIASQRKQILVLKASMLELLGRYQAAALAWEAASTILPGPADPVLLMASAYCMLAAGDVDSAAKHAGAVVFLSPDPVTTKLAGIVQAWANALSHSTVSVPDTIAALFEDASPRVALSALLFARSVSESKSREGYDKIILLRFPYFAEMLKDTPQPLMLLYASKESTFQTEPVVTESIPVDSSVDATSLIRFYQVGAYRKIVNAENAGKKLMSIGLDAHTTHNQSSDLYIVYVAAGTDPARTLLMLKDAGYEAWPLDAAP
jgi:hypothetical protein